MKFRLPYQRTFGVGFPPAPPHPDDAELHRLLPDGFYLSPGRLWGDHRVLIKQRIAMVDRCVRQALVELIGENWIARASHLQGCGECAEHIRRRASEIFCQIAPPDIAAFRYRAGKPDQR